MKLSLNYYILFAFEGLFAMVFALAEVICFLKDRKQYDKPERAKASDLCIVVIQLNTLLYVFLLNNYKGAVTNWTKIIVAVLLVSWAFFSYVVLLNGQKTCESCGLQGYKNGNWLNKDLAGALAVVTAWMFFFGKIIKPIILHRPIMIFDGVNISFSWEMFFMPVFMYCIIMPVNEEIVFRHGVFNLLLKVFKRKEEKDISRAVKVAIVLSAVLFAMVHIQGNYFLKFLQIFPIAITLTVLYKKQNIWQCVLVHGFFNLLNFVF